MNRSGYSKLLALREYSRDSGSFIHRLGSATVIGLMVCVEGDIDP